MRVNLGNVLSASRNTEYAVLGETLARRTYDESGHYIVRDFKPDARETLDDGLNNGVFESGTTTDSGNAASEDLLTLHLTPGKAYVAGYEIEKSHPTFIDIRKPRTTENVDNAITPVEVGNTIVVENVFGSPDISPETPGSIDEPFMEVSLHDNFTISKSTGTTGGPARGTETDSILTEDGGKIGVARVRSFDTAANNSTVTDFLSNSADNDSQFNLGLFDIKMFTEIDFDGVVTTSEFVAGAKITGANSGATGFVHSVSSDAVYLTNVNGIFSSGEKVKSSASTQSDELVHENGTTTDLTATVVWEYTL